jgi:2-polyprenyl-6-methoxyphenol hydroxylase-like FAD-dependent oxidoreductase
MENKIKKVLIVGGGIGGQSLAIALKKAGIETVIVEVLNEFNVYGVGIIQQANALKALDAIGVAQETMKRGMPYGQVKLCLAHGHQIGLVGAPPTPQYPSHNGISRRTLHDILFEEATRQGVLYKMGITVASMEDTAAAVHVKFTNGETGTYDIVVAADGINSKIRNMVFGEMKPRYVGLSVWRYPFKKHPDLDTGYIYFGKKSKLGFVPMSTESMYMFLVSAEGDNNPVIPENELAPRLKEYLKEYPVKIAQDAMEQITDAKLVNYRPIEALRMDNPWYKGRVIVIGDAAHATIPQLGSGAALAIEDAVVLADELQKNETVVNAFDAYMKRRYERCMMVVNASETLGEWEKMEFEGKPLPEGANAGAVMGKTIGALAAPI